MPCIQIKTNVEVSQEAAQAVKSALGQSIAHLPGKSEPWLMITLDIPDATVLWGQELETKPCKN